MPPVADTAFTWVGAPWGLQLTTHALSHVVHGWTTRQLRLRGTPEEEREGWERVAAAAGVAPDHLVRLRQVHGAAVHVAGGATSGIMPEADIAVAGSPAQALAVQVADCAPILVADDRGTIVGAAHAGWRGAEANVAGVAVAALTSRTGVGPGALVAAIGPCIGPCCYEVGGELLESFRARGWGDPECARWFVRRDGRLFFDLWQANAEQLARAGVPGARVVVSRLCTACHPDWFCSYRRDGPGAGRMAGYVRTRTG
jgi:YfiH family protein